jgi:hypothetical protein
MTPTTACLFSARCGPKLGVGGGNKNRRAPPAAPGTDFPLATPQRPLILFVFAAPPYHILLCAEAPARLGHALS